MGLETNAIAQSEHRRAPRHRCYRQARCVFNKDYSDLDVIVRNISDTGACISGVELICLPDRFELWIHDGYGGYSKRLARRVWTHGERAGVAFVDSR